MLDKARRVVYKRGTSEFAGEKLIKIFNSRGIDEFKEYWIQHNSYTEELIIEKAVVIKYDSESGNAPTIVAKGERLVAAKIKEVAIENDIPIYENKGLVDEIIKMKIDTEIPVELYEIMAQVLAFVYKIDKGYKK